MRPVRGPGGPVAGSRRSGFPAGRGARPPVHNQPFEWPEYAIPATGKGSAALSG
ncbi:hypothetical protein Sros01_24250 [Streptomyces roseochromogenus]|nr:hypothetical protein Sros01_24250 [Streptomyces roseochromogenus]